VHQLAGIIELENWLQDLLQQGLATALTRPPAFWEEFAARMVNAKLSGIARRIRSFQNWLQSDNAHERLLSEIGELYLFAKAFQKLETLPADLQQEMLTTAGATIKKEIVFKQESIPDKWLVIGQSEGKEEDIRYRRTWLQGITTHKTALLLDFAWRFSPFEFNWKVGSLLQAEVAYYPAAYPQRALVKDFVIIYEPIDLAGYADWEVFFRQYADALAQNPWLLTFPGLLDGLTPVLPNEQLSLIDTNLAQLPIQTAEEIKWKILAIGGGHPMQIFGEWNGKSFTPLTVFTQSRIIPLLVPFSNGQNA